MTTYPEKSINYSTKPSVTGHISRISLPAGFAGGALLIIYFLIVKSMELHLITELRWINFVLIIPVIIFAIKKYVNTRVAKTYVEALAVSVASAVFSFFVLALFMVVYLSIDTTFMNHLYQASFPQLQLNQLGVFLLLMMEGIVGGVVISFVLLQFFLDDIRKAA